MKIRLQIMRFNWPDAAMGQRLADIARLVAAYVDDACNLYAGGNADEYAERLESVRQNLVRLQQHCDAVGRPYSEIERTALAGIQLTEECETVDQISKWGQSLAELGIQHVIFNMPQGYEIRPVEILGQEIVPRAAEFS